MNVFNKIKEYRTKVIESLKQSNNYYDTKIIELKSFNKIIKYHRWLHPFQGEWEVSHLFTHEILKNLSQLISPKSTVIDIGAQAGYMSVAYSLFANKVISFEPNPVAFEVLEKNSKLNTNIIPYNVGISNEESIEEFHYSDYGFCNGGFAKKTDYGIGVTGHVCPIDVYVKKLDEFVLNEEVISLIKIDAEGHDYIILDSIQDIIKKFKPYIITEIYTGSSEREINQLLKTIKHLGYKCYDESKNKLNINNLGNEIKSITDINISSGNNLICIYDIK